MVMVMVVVVVVAGDGDGDTARPVPHSPIVGVMNAVSPELGQRISTLIIFP